MAYLPYDGTSGWAGSDTSRLRAVGADASGKTTGNQVRTLYALETMGVAGLTWKELADFYDWHHGVSSGVLSVLHKGQLIARLNETRKGCKVYVALDYVAGRKIETQGRKANNALKVVADVFCGCLCCSAIETRLESL